MEIRAARPEDHAAYVRLFHELGVPDPVPTAEQFAANVVPRMFVACDPDVVGYVSWRAYGDVAHVVQIVTDATVRGRGIAHALLAAIREAARAAGCTRWYLNVRRDNARALHVYRQAGFGEPIEGWFLKMTWEQIAALPIEPVRVIEPSSAQDAEIARRFALPIGRVAFLRARAGCPAIALVEDGDLVGFTSFAPSFSGCMPFLVARASLAGALLAACRPHAQQPHVSISLEHGRDVAEALIAAGAETIFELFQMSAELQ